MCKEKEDHIAREEQDCIFWWQWPVCTPQLWLLSASVLLQGAQHRCKSKLALKKLTHHKRGRAITSVIYARLITPIKLHLELRIKAEMSRKGVRVKGWHLLLLQLVKVSTPSFACLSAGIVQHAHCKKDTNIPVTQEMQKCCCSQSNRRSLELSGFIPI